MDRLLREANPPTGQLASPKPQYKKPGEDAYEPVEGQYGAPFAILKNASGQVISPATDTQLEQVKSELELIKSELQTIKANQLIVLDRLEQIERALLISAGLRHEYYIDGMEYAPGGWVEGITSGPEDWWERYKAEDHMYFFTRRNPDGRTDVSYVTKEKVDLTGVRFVYVELEAKALVSSIDVTSPNLYLIASIDSEGTYNDFEARSMIYRNRDGSSEGRVIRGLNVTGLTGEYYLRLHIASHATGDQAFDLETKIFRVWGE